MMGLAGLPRGGLGLAGIAGFALAAGDFVFVDFFSFACEGSSSDPKSRVVSTGAETPGDILLFSAAALGALVWGAGFRLSGGTGGAVRTSPLGGGGGSA